MQQVNLTLTPEHWKVILEGLSELQVKTALPVMQACQAQIDEQLAAHEMLSRKPHVTGFIPLGYAAGPGISPILKGNDT